MRRVVSVWFPHWPTDRLRRRLGSVEGAAEPLVTALHDGRRRVLAAVDPAAAALGLRPGLAVAQALALVPGLQVEDAEPEADAAALIRLARWCHAITPLAAPCPPDGLWLDVTGCAHLAGGEAALLERLVARLARDRLAARAAVADTPGAAHALARHAHGACTVVAPGGQTAAMAPLPVAALRISPELETALRRLGFDQVSHLVRIPRALLTRRFGPLPGMRLDQAHGAAGEPLAPLAPEHPLQHRLAFVEPLLTAEAFRVAIPRLVEPLCAAMEAQGVGARRLDLLFERVDNEVVAIQVGTARPSRDGRHLARMLEERLETVDPGLGVEAMRLVAPFADPLRWEQQREGGGAYPVARLVDRLANRLGEAAVYRAVAVETELPERLVDHGPAADVLDGGAGTAPKGDETQAGETRGDETRGDGVQGEPAASGAMARMFVAAGAAGAALGGERAEGPGRMTKLRLGRLRANHLRLVENAPAAVGGPRPGACDASSGGVSLGAVSLGAVSLGAVSLGAASLGAASLGAASLPKLGLECDPPLLEWRPRRERAVPPRQAWPAWPNRLEAPSRLFMPPRPVKALAALPDAPPTAFTWRRRHRVRRAEGPERVFGEWWRFDAEREMVRDYFIVEDEDGQRFWLFRRGNGVDPATGNLDWFLHGLF